MKEFVDGVIDGTTISLEEWLKIIFSRNPFKVYPNNCFPTDEMKEEYLFKIQERSEEEVENLIRKFLVHSGYYGMDKYHIKNLLTYYKGNDLVEKIKSNEYWRRIFSKKPPWEGITWILDLIPFHPNDAIECINAFFLVHCQILPDNVLYGLGEARELIRAKFLETEYPNEILLNLKPIEFEWLVEKLYNEMGYSTTLTPKSYDGGIDIKAEKKEASKKEVILIQCKRFKNNIGVKEIRALLGIVSDNKANKGVLVCCSDFSYTAKKFSKNNWRIELINYKELIKLLNIYLGTHWPLELDRIFMDNKIKLIKKTQTKD